MDWNRFWLLITGGALALSGTIVNAFLGHKLGRKHEGDIVCRSKVEEMVVVVFEHSNV